MCNLCRLGTHALAPKWRRKQSGRPIYNLRSKGREFPIGRCLILADGFYEFTSHTDPESKRKHL